MERKGFTIVELMIALFISSIIIIICFRFFLLNLKEFNIINGEVDGNANTRIAMDFIVEHIREGHDLIIGAGDVTIDGDRIYLKNNILRHGTDSQQIAYNITSFGVVRLKSEGLYKVTIMSFELCQNTLINKRK
jgi:prepilin-type N-terminal cleavage/methylation domain-containing protein